MNTMFDALDAGFSSGGKVSILMAGHREKVDHLYRPTLLKSCIKLIFSQR